MATAKMRNMDMTKGPFLKKIIWFAIPLILTGVLHQFYNAADLVVVGMFDGQIALAAVGATGSLTNLVIGLFLGLSVGAGVSVAHHIGEKKENEVQKVVHTSILLSFILGITIAVIGYVLAPTLLAWMGTPENVISFSTLYVRIIFMGFPAQMVYNYAASMLRSAGDAKRPLIFLAISGLVNVALNFLLVAGLRMGVAGVAIATIASQYLSASMILVYMLRTEGPLHLSFRELRLNRSKVSKILYIGIPSGIQGTLFSLSNVLIQSSINSFGDTVMAGSAAAGNLEGFIYIAMNAMYHVSLTFVGQNVGARAYHNIKKIMVYSLSVVTAIGLTLGILLFVFHESLVGLYAPDNPEVMAAAVERLLVIAFTYFMCGTMEVLCGGLRAMGKSVTSMIISLCGACAFRILWLATVFQWINTPTSIYLSYPASWILTNVTMLIFLVLGVKGLVKKASRKDAEIKEKEEVALENVS